MREKLLSWFTNPVLVKELRGRMRGSRAAIILTVYLSLVGIITLLIYLAVANNGSGINDPDAGRIIGRMIFYTVMTAALILVCIIAPALTASSIVGEKERQTYDLLITTLLSPVQIAFGKLASALSFSLLLIIAILPLAGLAFLFGGVSGAELIIAIAGLLTTALFFAVSGMFWSTLMKGTLGATIASQGGMILRMLLIPFLLLVGSGIFGSMFWNNQGKTLEGMILLGITWLLISLQPFLAFGFSLSQIVSGHDVWTYDMSVFGQSETMLSPWAAYVLISLFLTAVMFFITVRRLRPETDTGKTRAPSVS